MDKIEKVHNLLVLENKSIETVRELINENFDSYEVYPDSIFYEGGSYFFMAIFENSKKLIILNHSELSEQFFGFETEFEKGYAKICDLSNGNSEVLRNIFPFTKPSNHHGTDVTIGLGDRLGMASAGHIRLFKGREAFPVLAQQSIRELNLTGRTYKDVLAAASWAVFQEGYTKGYGADGDHLKTPEEVQMAINCGFTMITLDCSEHIDNSISEMSESEIEKKYDKIENTDKAILEKEYINSEFVVGDKIITFSSIDFKKVFLIYNNAIQYTIDIYNDVIRDCGRSIDFEMSIDETLTSTSPESHYFVAKELIDAGLRITSLAPRFCGEFQKGIDYIGNIKEFTKEFEMHAEIAKSFGYKISVHSGSDKFKVFPIVGKKTKYIFHLKTAGTNWLEAVRIIAAKKPDLYRKMHKFAIKNLDEAKKYYHISAKKENVPDVSKLKDRELPDLMNQNDARQVLHITYGLILQAKNDDGTYMFKDEIYSILHRNESDYYKALEKHIGKHLDMLGV